MLAQVGEQLVPVGESRPACVGTVAAVTREHQPNGGSDVAGQLRRRVDELEAENLRLRSLLGIDDRAAEPAPRWEPTLFGDVEAKPAGPTITQASSAHEKVALFRSLFRGRDDVYAQRWESLRSGKSGWSPALKGGFATDRGRPKEYLPLTDEVIEAHLAGRHHFGLYPLLRDDTCQLLVCDFDGEGWLLDALAYLDAARADGVPAALERSRSGDGGHVWSFFEGRLPAASARRIGAYLVREAMTVRAEIDLASYDRLFPSQDFLPRQGFGNLIALPLEGQRRKEAKTVF